MVFNPKIMIACSTYNKMEKYLDKYLEGVNNQTYENWELIFCDNSADDKHALELEQMGYKVLRSKPNPIIHIALKDAINKLRDYFLKSQFDSMLILEQDQIPPPTALEVLVKANKPVIGLPYLLTSGNTNLCVHDPIRYQIMTMEELVALARSKKIVRVWGCGHGCVLIKRKVLEQVEFRIDHPERPRASPDTWWYEDLLEKRIPVYCVADPEIMSTHLRVQETSEVDKIEDSIVLKEATFVKCKGDYWNSATRDRVHLMKGQVKRLPKVISRITYDAIKQGLLIKVDMERKKKELERIEAIKVKRLDYRKKTKRMEEDGKVHNNGQGI